MRRNRRRGANGEPWLRKWSNGDYVWTVSIGRKPLTLRDRTGAPLKGEENKAAAFEVWHGMMQKAAVPLSGEENEVLVVCDLYLQSLSKHATPKTVERWGKFYNEFCQRWPGLLVKEVKPYHLNTWFDENESWGPTYRNIIGSAIKSAFNWAVGAEGGNIIPRNPLTGMKLPRVRSRGAEALISDKDHLHLLAQVPEDLKQILVALRHTGTRPSHVWRATAANLDLGQEALVYGDWNTDPESSVHKTFKKTGQALVVPLTPTVFQLCKTLAEKHPKGPLFRTKRGEAWNAQKIASRLWFWAKKLKLTNVILYGYRHTVATDLLSQGVPDAEVAAILGQKNTDMIYKHYGHLGHRIKRLRETLTAHRPAMIGEDVSGIASP